MFKKTANKITRSFRRNERGDGALGSVISMGMFITLLILFVWMVLTYYSFRVLSSAANEGAAVAARYNVSADGNRTVALNDGVEYAEDLISDSGTRALVENVTVTAGPENEQIATIVVEGNAVTPLFSMRLTATGSAPVEEFRPQGEELGAP